MDATTRAIQGRKDRRMSDTISRQAAINALRKMQTYKMFSGDDMLLIDQAGAMTELMLLPPAEPKRGKWIDKGVYTYVDDHRHLYKCDQCGNGWLDTPDFCPNCGADMRGEQDG